MVVNIVLPLEMKRHIFHLARFSSSVSGETVLCRGMFAFDPVIEPSAGLGTHSTDLSNWDFLQDLDFLQDPDPDDNAVFQAAKPEVTTNERLKEKNRKAQQRARQKKKVGKSPLQDQS